ncbi:hypothetical protein [Ramlibacter sp.]|uniref:hypothetical protein n=1 Tax=Ramlibacter sp. TaxID=1917967 RepID=UPI002C94F47A|nr:hypothetical protein [Ramlibacter sp.]HWI82601.1 hypothetical protein [Ramlibacter sp.]
MISRRLLCAATAASLFPLVAGGAFAAGSQDVTVQAKVLSVCKLNFAAAGAVTVNMGDLNPSLTGEVTKPVSVAYRCTKDAAAPTVTIPAALTLSGPGSINYTIDAFSTAAGAGFSADATATSTIRIPWANFADQPAGDYTQTITLTMAP